MIRQVLEGVHSVHTILISLSAYHQPELDILRCPGLFDLMFKPRVP